MNYPSILYDLTDKENRTKLQDIVDALKPKCKDSVIWLGKTPVFTKEKNTPSLEEALDATQSKK